MTETVERVAQALRKECQEIFGSSWNNDVAEQLARAAMGAMRFADKEMIERAWASRGFYDDLKPGSCWYDMMGAALGEPQFDYSDEWSAAMGVAA